MDSVIGTGARGPGLSAGAVARRLGVATTTLRTWHQRYGLGPSEHEAGQHRRYTPHDMAALTVMTQLTARGVPAGEAARAARRAPVSWSAEHPSPDSAARGLARAARRLDVLAVHETLTAAVAGHGVVHTFHTLAAPAFALISQARSDESHKTLARRVLGRCLSEVFAAVPRPTTGLPVRVLLLAADARRDVAALDALAAALAEEGIPSVHLGAGLPHKTITEAVERSRPAAVVIWSHAPHPALPGLLAAVAAAPGWRPVVVTAGRHSATPTPTDAIAAPPTPTDAVAAAPTLTAAPTPADPAAAPTLTAAPTLADPVDAAPPLTVAAAPTPADPVDAAPTLAATPPPSDAAATAPTLTVAVAPTLADAVAAVAGLVVE